MKVWLRVHGFEFCSWTFVWENLCNAFEKAGEEIYYSAPSAEDAGDTVEVWWGDPQFWRWSDLDVSARIAIALSEAHSIQKAGREEAIANLQRSDMLICPSDAATRAYKEAPLDIPIRVVSFGVDESQFQYVDRDWDGPLNFLHAGATQFRKGSWIVPEAFVSAFDRSDDVKLSIVAQQVYPMFARLKAEYSSHPNIEFVDGFREAPESVYADQHIYVSPHLSEGFGLCPLEAMATGMAGLIARCSAPLDYFSNEFGWFIEMSELYSPVEQCLPDTSGFWRLPDVDSLARGMLLAYENRHECEKRGREASKFILNNLTWKHTVEGIKSVIEEVLSEKSFSRDERAQRRETLAARSEQHRAVC
jgi:glycosyltransferase involved in cell wall biosynthesis